MEGRKERKEKRKRNRGREEGDPIVLYNIIYYLLKKSNQQEGNICRNPLILPYICPSAPDQKIVNNT